MEEKKIVRMATLPEEIRSAYLDWVFKEKLTFRNICFDLEAKTASALVDVEADFRNEYDKGNNSWHWSANTAYNASAQLVIGYLCTALGKPKRELGEILQISSNMSTYKPILSVNNVPLNLSFSKYIERPSRILGEMECKINNGDFEGRTRFVVNK